MQDPTTTAAEELLSPRRLAPSAAMLGAHMALTAVLGRKGVAVVIEVAPHIAATLDRVIHDTLSPDEIDTLIRLLGRIEQAARTPGATAAS